MHPTRHAAPVLLVAAAALVAAASSCRRNTTEEKSGDGPKAGSFDKPALLRAFGECALGTYRDFQQTLPALDAATKRFEAEGTPDAREAARAAWKTAIDAWQRAELFTLGPAGPSGTSGTPGGQDLRDPIYAWPLLSRCLVDQQIVSQEYDKPSFASALVSTRSLAAVEYLLFYDGPDNGCPPEAAINAQGSWKAIAPADLTKRRAAYARAALADVMAKTATLVDAWDPAKGNFVNTLATAGHNDTYKTMQMGFNAVSNAAFYFDTDVKNMKVGLPAGLTLDATNAPECATPPCLDKVESPWAHRSKEHVKNNLVGFEMIMRGCGANGDGLGFDDLLVAVGGEATAKRLADATAATKAALDELKEPTFEEDLQKNPAGVKKLFDALRAVAVLMKSEFVTVLDLELPRKAEGDND
jgi:uncharacterized iron-regulated protein